jgi:hypothetical protein
MADISSTDKSHPIAQHPDYSRLWPALPILSMRTIGNEVDDGRLHRWSGQWRRSGIDGCQLGCCTLVLHRFRVLRTSEPSLVSYRHGVGYRRSPGNLASLATRSIGECRMPLWSAWWSASRLTAPEVIGVHRPKLDGSPIGITSGPHLVTSTSFEQADKL